MKDKDLENLTKELSYLGCAFFKCFSDKTPDPEKTILKALSCFWDKPDMFSMLIGALYYRVHGLIHVERLLSLATNLTEDEKILLKVISHKLVLKGDKRFNLILKKLPTKKKKLSSIPEDLKDPYLLKSLGVDESFKFFKMKVADGLLPEEKKFYQKSAIIKNNMWLRFRVLIGPTYRADLAYLKASKSVKTPLEAFKVLGCSRAVAYDLWSKLSPIQDVKWKIQA
jgi:hypothetical protein